MKLYFLLWNLHGRAQLSFHVWKSEDSLQELVISFLHVDSRTRTQIVSAGSHQYYPWSHPTAQRFLKSLNVSLINKYHKERWVREEKDTNDNKGKRVHCSFVSFVFLNGDCLTISQIHRHTELSFVHKNLSVVCSGYIHISVLVCGL